MTNKPERYFFMDTLRGTLMSLGIVLHSARIFSPEQDWIISSQDTSLFADYLAEIIHAFRMPAFFVVSGFFCVLTLKRYAPEQFLKVRLTRIAVPLIAAALLLNTTQAYLLNQTGWRSYDVASYLRSDENISHLWFLVNLIVYFLLAYLLVRFCRPALRLIATFAARLVTATNMYVVLLLLPLLNVAIRALSTLGFPLYAHPFGVVSVMNIMIYLPYFLVGGVLYTQRDMLHKFSKISPLFSVAVIVAAILAMPYVQQLGDLPGRVAGVYVAGLETWSAVTLCFYIFYNFFNADSRLAYAISDASYTVYLFHHILVIAFGLLLLPLKLAPELMMLMVIAFAGSCAYAMHYFVVARVPVMRWLFNGK